MPRLPTSEVKRAVERYRLGNASVNQGGRSPGFAPHSVNRSTNSTLCRTPCQPRAVRPATCSPGTRSCSTSRLWSRSSGGEGRRYRPGPSRTSQPERAYLAARYGETPKDSRSGRLNGRPGTAPDTRPLIREPPDIEPTSQIVSTFSNNSATCWADAGSPHLPLPSVFRDAHGHPATCGRSPSRSPVGRRPSTSPDQVVRRIGRSPAIDVRRGFRQQLISERSHTSQSEVEP